MKGPGGQALQMRIHTLKGVVITLGAPGVVVAAGIGDRVKLDPAPPELVAPPISTSL